MRELRFHKWELTGLACKSMLSFLLFTAVK